MLSTLLLTTALLLTPQGKGKGHGHGKDKGAAHVPPGLAKKGGLPPGLAKKFGRLPAKPYIALDPRYTDRAWFLIEGRWELRKGFDATLQIEVRDCLRLPLAPPPVPLPKVGIELHVVLFD